MARIKIKDLPKDMKVSKEEMRKIRGGLLQVASKSSSISRIVPTYPTYTGTLTYIGWTPPHQDMAGCGCMGMSQDPKTMLPG